MDNVERCFAVATATGFVVLIGSVTWLMML